MADVFEIQDEVAAARSGAAILSLGTPRDVWPLVEAPLQRAVALDPNLAEAIGLAAAKAMP